MKVLLALLAPLCVLVAPAPARAQPDPPPGAVPVAIELVPAGGVSPRTVLAWDREGILYFSVDDLALLLGAVKHWRPELGRVIVAVPGHEAAVMDGSSIAVIDGGRYLHLPGLVFRWQGRLLVPVDLLVDREGGPRPWVAPLPVSLSRARRVLSASVREGTIQSAQVLPEVSGWKLLFVADRPFKHQVIRAQRSAFVFLLEGITVDPLLHPLPTEHDWFQGLRLRNLPEGLEVSFTAGYAVAGYRIDRPEAKALEVFMGFDEIEVEEGKLRRFAPIRGLVPRSIHVVALDPGHGGDDSGAALDKETEARVTVDLCRRIATALRLELDVEGVLLREPQERLSSSERAERANHADADLLLSVHVHSREGGPAAYVAQPREGGRPVPREAAALGFREFGRGQAPFTNSSRLLARTLVDAVSGGLETEPLGVYSENLAELQGAAMPAILIEIGAGNAPPDDARLDALARSVVEGVQLFLLSGVE